MNSENLDWFIVNDTDEYLNEYIPIEENSRYHLTKFTGSTGTALVSKYAVFLFVDGRYHLQADNETDPQIVTVVKMGLDNNPDNTLIGKLKLLSKTDNNIGLVSKKISLSQYKKLKENLPFASFKSYETDPILKSLELNQETQHEKVRIIPNTITGKSTEQKISEIRTHLKTLEIDGIIISELPEIAYLTNMRGNNIPFSSCFKGKVLITDSEFILFSDIACPDNNCNMHIKKEKKFDDYIKSLKNLKIGISPNITNLHIYNILGQQAKELNTNLLSTMKSIKTAQEISHMKECFERTDKVVLSAIKWVRQSLKNADKISEKDFADKVKSLFTEHGAIGLSFEVLAASGTNTAIIHYTHPSEEKFISENDLVLLDCGGYFEGGYATDITRTFLASGESATSEQKQLYTSVMKGFLTGINNPVDKNTSGFEIDQNVRETVNKCPLEGFSFAHGTGHGIGIPVHECPPRISPADAVKTPLKSGMCFTIEPGLYKPGFGGVRIENSVRLETTADGSKIISFSRCPLDESLIEHSMLSNKEKIWLENYQKEAIN